MNIEKLSDLKPSDYNPRKITDKALEGLKYSLEEFGDISGIVYNKHTGNLVAGHQRVKALQEKYGDLEPSLSEEGTAAFVTPDGNIFKVRIVDWDIDKEKAANIAANSEAIQGEFTDELLPLVEEISLNLPELSAKLLFNDIEMVSSKMIDDSLEIDTKELSYKPQFGVIIICESDEEQREVFEKLQAEGYNLRVVTT